MQVLKEAILFQGVYEYDHIYVSGLIIPAITWSLDSFDLVGTAQTLRYLYNRHIRLTCEKLSTD